MLGLRNPRSLALLASRGFGQSDLDEGWKLLRNLAKVSFDAPPPKKADPKLIVELDEWENTWFPVADATLSRRFPAVHADVFRNLSQTEGPAVVVSVGTFVERLTGLRDGAGERQQAAELLAARGLDEGTLAKASALLVKLGKPETHESPPDLEAQREGAAAAEEELWSWYREWSQLARGVITDRRLLRELGFLKIARPAEDCGEEGQSEPPERALETTTVAPAS